MHMLIFFKELIIEWRKTKLAHLKKNVSKFLNWIAIANMMHRIKKLILQIYLSDCILSQDSAKLFWSNATINTGLKRMADHCRQSYALLLLLLREDIFSYFLSSVIHLIWSSRNLFHPPDHITDQRYFLVTHIRVAGSPIRLRQADHLKLQRVLETDLFQRPFLFYYGLNSVLCKMQKTFSWCSRLWTESKIFSSSAKYILINKTNIYLENFRSIQIFDFRSGLLFICYVAKSWIYVIIYVLYIYIDNETCNYAGVSLTRENIRHGVQSD